jgi:hypothetical protein
MRGLTPRATGLISIDDEYEDTDSDESDQDGWGSGDSDESDQDGWGSGDSDDD